MNNEYRRELTAIYGDRIVPDNEFDDLSWTDAMNDELIDHYSKSNPRELFRHGLFPNWLTVRDHQLAKECHMRGMCVFRHYAFHPSLLNDPDCKKMMFCCGRQKMDLYTAALIAIPNGGKLTSNDFIHLFGEHLICTDQPSDFDDITRENFIKILPYVDHDEIINIISRHSLLGDPEIVDMILEKHRLLTEMVVHNKHVPVHRRLEILWKKSLRTCYWESDDPIWDHITGDAIEHAFDWGNPPPHVVERIMKSDKCLTADHIAELCRCYMSHADVLKFIGDQKLCTNDLRMLERLRAQEIIRRDQCNPSPSTKIIVPVSIPLRDRIHTTNKRCQTLMRVCPLFDEIVPSKKEDTLDILGAMSIIDENNASILFAIRELTN